MDVTVVLVISLWISTVFTPGLSCPKPCTCPVKFGHQFADCAYKDLTEIPDGLPPHVTTVGLSANRISLVPSGGFNNVTEITSLWMVHNEIVVIEQGALSPLVHLRNFDVSYNKIIDFPWEDLQNLTSLQLLKMNHNEMSHLPKDAFTSLKDLRSIRLNNNRFTTIAEGTFEGLVSLSHLQIFTNPFACTCSLDWLRDWISGTTISVPDQDEIRCSSPEKLKGLVIGQLPISMCPKVTIRTEPETHNSTLQEGSLLVLTCKFTGNPKPLVIQIIQSRSQRERVAGVEGGVPEVDSAGPSEDSVLSNNLVLVFTNWNLIVSHFKENGSGNFSCSSTNEFWGDEDSVSVGVVTLPKSTP